MPYRHLLRPVRRGSDLDERAGGAQPRPLHFVRHALPRRDGAASVSAAASAVSWWRRSATSSGVTTEWAVPRRKGAARVCPAPRCGRWALCCSPLALGRGIVQPRRRRGRQPRRGAARCRADDRGSRRRHGGAGHARGVPRGAHGITLWTRSGWPWPWHRTCSACAGHRRRSGLRRPGLGLSPEVRTRRQRRGRGRGRALGARAVPAEAKEENAEVGGRGPLAGGLLELRLHIIMKKAFFAGRPGRWGQDGERMKTGNTTIYWANGHYTIITADSHAGGSHAAYREYLDPVYLEEFDAWRAKYRNAYKTSGHAAAPHLGQRHAQRSAGGRWRRGRSHLPEHHPSVLPELRPLRRAPRPKSTSVGSPASGPTTVGWWNSVGEFPERRAGIGQIFLNDIDDAIADVHSIKDHGLRGGILLPNVPPDVSGSDPSYDLASPAVEGH